MWVREFLGFFVRFFKKYCIIRIDISEDTGIVEQKFLKWWDGFRLSAMGIVLASKKRKFWLVFLVSFVIFGTLLSLLSGGMGAINLFFATNFGGKIKILGDGFLSLFGVGKTFPDWLLTFSISLLQALLIALIVLVWKKKRSNNTANYVSKTNSRKGKFDTDNGSNVQSVGIIAGLAILGSGCPTCGTALVTPMLGAVFSTGSYAIAGTISGVITFLAIIVAIISVKKVAEEAYVIMIDEEWRKNHRKEKSREK